MTGLIILGVIIVLALILVLMYNGLVKSKVRTEESKSQIEVQLERRGSLIPNLVETVKGYTKHEQETLEKVIAARNAMISAGDLSEKMEHSNELAQGLKSIFALAENYPDLKANTNFLQLQEELTNTENKVSYARQLYNSSVAEYNIKVRSFPTNIIAKMFSFKEAPLLEAPQELREVPKVSF